MSNMRIAVAGTCGLALSIAREIHEQTSHQLLILSRNVSLTFWCRWVLHDWQPWFLETANAHSSQHQTALISQGYLCQIVDYNDPSSLQHSLMGVDTVVSTVTGTAQLRLIEAAVACRVRRFAPAEFEGRPHLRGENDPLERGKALTLAHLQYYRSHIQSTVFVCGILYERFSVNGMISHRIGVNTGYGNEGDYILDARNMTAEPPVYSSAGNLSHLCLTSAYDVGRFVVRALDMEEWPAEMTFCGERISVNALVDVVQTCRGRVFNAQWKNTATLQYDLTMAQMAGDVPKQRRLLTHIATAEECYDFATPAYLNALFPDIQPLRFRDWFTRNWASVP